MLRQTTHSPEQVFSDADNDIDDILKTADFLWQKALLERRLWPDIESEAAGVACAFMTRARREGLDIDVSAFAALLGKTRPTVHRMLGRWQALGYCELRRAGRRTLVFGSPKMLSLCSQYLDTLTTLRAGNLSRAAE